MSVFSSSVFCVFALRIKSWKPAYKFVVLPVLANFFASMVICCVYVTQTLIFDVIKGVLKKSVKHIFLSTMMIKA